MYNFTCIEKNYFSIWGFITDRTEAFRITMTFLQYSWHSEEREWF